jgi:hypothetical protein
MLEHYQVDSAPAVQNCVIASALAGRSSRTKCRMDRGWRNARLRGIEMDVGMRRCRCSGGQDRRLRRFPLGFSLRSMRTRDASVPGLNAWSGSRRRWEAELLTDPSDRWQLDLAVARDGRSLAGHRVLPHLVLRGLAGDVAAVLTQVPIELALLTQRLRPTRPWPKRSPASARRARAGQRAPARSPRAPSHERHPATRPWVCTIRMRDSTIASGHPARRQMRVSVPSVPTALGAYA